jgi:hypothetical protein
MNTIDLAVPTTLVRRVLAHGSTLFVHRLWPSRPADQLQKGTS